MTREYTLLFGHVGSNFKPQGIQPDKPGCVVLVVGFGGVGFHGGNIRVVEADRLFTPGRDDVALIKLQSDRAGDILLALGNERL